MAAVFTAAFGAFVVIVAIIAGLGVGIAIAMFVITRVLEWIE